MDSNQVYRPTNPIWETDVWNVQPIYEEQMIQYGNIWANSITPKKRE